MDETTWLWIGTAGMAVGAAVLAVLGKRRTADEEGHTVLHAIVPLIAALGYLAQATGQGAVVLAGGRELLYARYVDWSITTPLLLLALSMTALHGAHRRTPLVAALLAADVLMILTGLFWALSDATGPKWTWYVVSCGAFVVVYAVLFGPLRREAAGRDEVRRAAYRRNVSVLAGLWLLYPVITLLGPDGTGVWSATVATATITVLDLLAKVGYGLLAAAASKRIADADLSREAARPAGDPRPRRRDEPAPRR